MTSHGRCRSRQLCGLGMFIVLVLVGVPCSGRGSTSPLPPLTTTTQLKPYAVAAEGFNCTDNASFADATGLRCEQWAGDSCFAAMDWYGYSESEQDELVKQCSSSCGTCFLQDVEANLQDAAVAFCRTRLSNDSDCCLDTKVPRRVQEFKITRPGAEWYCNNTAKGNCYDDLGGIRGTDSLWVPEHANCQTPRLLFLHGGSFMFSSPRTDGYNVLLPKLARAGGVVALAIDYPLAPVARYPAMLDATIRALEYLFTHGPPGCTNEPGKGPPVFIAGDSSGGSLAYSAILSVNSGQHIIHGGLSKIAGAFFYSPWTNMRCDTPSYMTNAYSSVKTGTVGVWHNGDIAFRDRPIANIATYYETAVEYLGDTKLLDDPVASPILAKPEMLQGLPPLLFVVAANELVMGDAVIAAQNAASAQVDVTLDIFDGMWHVFPMYAEGCGSGQLLWPAQRALRRTGRWLRDVAASGASPCRPSEKADAYANLRTPVTRFHIQKPMSARMNGLKEQSGDGFPCKSSPIDMALLRRNLKLMFPYESYLTMFGIFIFAVPMLCVFFCCSSAAREIMCCKKHSLVVVPTL